MFGYFIDKYSFAVCPVVYAKKAALVKKLVLRTQ